MLLVCVKRSRKWRPFIVFKNSADKSSRSVRRSVRCARSRRHSRQRKKTAEMIHTEIAREVTMLSAVSLPTAIEVDASIWKPWRRRFALPCTKRE